MKSDVDTMKTAIICYDLRNVKPYDNVLVKAKLSTFSNVAMQSQGQNALSPFPDWVKLHFPDTTIIVTVVDSITAKHLIDETLGIIASVGAEANRVYVAFIDPDNDFLWNAKLEKPVLPQF